MALKPQPPWEASLFRHPTELRPGATSGALLWRFETAPGAAHVAPRAKGVHVPPGSFNELATSGAVDHAQLESPQKSDMVSVPKHWIKLASYGSGLQNATIPSSDI